ncbi:hypothetical protein Tco_1494144 [Tanacetum coccineum]
MLNHSKAEPIGFLRDVMCQVGVTTIIAKFLILDMPIDRDIPILVGKGFLHTCGGILNTIDNITPTFDGICHQTFRAAKTSLDTAKSDSDDEEEYAFQRNKFGAPIYGPKPVRYLNYSDPLDQSLALQEVLNPFRKICVWKKVVSFLGSLPVALQHVEWKPDYTRCFNKKEDNDGHYKTYKTMRGNDDEAGSSRTKRSRQYKTMEEVLLPQFHLEFLEWEGCNRYAKSRMGVLCHEFYSTYEFDKVCADDELKTKKIIKFRLGGRAHSLTLLEFAHRLGLYHVEEHDKEGFDVYFQGGWMKRKGTDLDTTMLRELIDSEGRLKPEAPQSDAPRVDIPRAHRASMQDLYERIVSMEIRQGAIKRMAYRQSYHWDRYAGVFEHMAGVYNVTLQRAYNPLGYAQP